MNYLAAVLLLLGFFYIVVTAVQRQAGDSENDTLVPDTEVLAMGVCFFRRLFL